MDVLLEIDRLVKPRRDKSMHVENYSCNVLNSFLVIINVMVTGDISRHIQYICLPRSSDFSLSLSHTHTHTHILTLTHILHLSLIHALHNRSRISFAYTLKSNPLKRHIHLNS